MSTTPVAEENIIHVDQNTGQSDDGFERGG